MLSRYVGYREGKEPITTTAYFCLTVLEASKGKRRFRLPAAAKRYRVSQPVLKQLANLTPNRGGMDARKAQGVHQSFTLQETHCLKAARTAIIRWVVEFAYDPNASLEMITACGFPPCRRSQ